MRLPKFTPGQSVLAAAISAILIITACGGGGGGGGSGGGTAAVQTSSAENAAITTPAAAAPVASSVQLAGASVSKTLEVPSGLASGPFASERRLNVPPGFNIQLYARVPGARFLARTPDGNTLVSVPGEGKIVLLRDRGNATPEQVDFATGLKRPHDMVFHRIGDTTYLYIAETNRVSRAVYNGGANRIGELQTVVGNLPDSSTPELRGQYGHELKNIALSPDNKLYISIASSCNACIEDTQSDPLRGAIYQYNADGSGARLFARGLRNAEGLDIVPGTNALWVAVNNRDELRYPLNQDWDGDGSNDFGKIMPAYVDQNPPEPFTFVRDGGNYGWPFCNNFPNDTMSNLDSLPDYELNRLGERINCSNVDRPSKGLRAHSAPLGFSFLHNTNVPAAYRSGAVVALHGCWNCTSLTAGYKVVYFPFDGNGNAGMEMDLVTGFVTNPDSRSFWGRPVDAIGDSRGGILISDDYAGAVYRLYPAQ